jgi:hypothetical protein
VAVWIKPGVWNTELESVVSKQLDSHPDYEAFDFRRQSGSDKIEAAIAVGGANYKATATDDIADAEWQHVAFTYDGATLIVYRNGDDGTHNTDPNGDLTAATVALWVGGNPSFTGRHFEGQIDDVRVYSRALTDVEVLRLYNMRIQPVRAGAIARRRR